MIALTHPPSVRLELGERTFLRRSPVNVTVAAAQHTAYCRALTDCGADVISLSVNEGDPDGTFIEDTAIVLDEVAVVCSMGSPSRREELARVAPILSGFRELVRIELPATIEGGDVVCAGHELFVGYSSRTNAAGVASLASAIHNLGYRITPVPVFGCLHLKTACSALPDGRLLVNPQWINQSALRGHDLICVPDTEPWGANVCAVNGQLIMAADQSQTCDQLARLGYTVHPVDVSEFAKCEAGVTCLSLLFQN